MIGILRILVFAFLALSIVYVMVSIYSRSVRREKLEKAWDTDPANEGAARSDRDAYIREGMIAYQHSLRRKLIGLVYVLPLVAIGLIMYFVNWN